VKRASAAEACGTGMRETGINPCGRSTERPISSLGAEQVVGRLLGGGQRFRGTVLEDAGQGAALPVRIRFCQYSCLRILQSQEDPK
jgi:hypothetical protein